MLVLNEAIMLATKTIASITRATIMLVLMKAIKVETKTIATITTIMLYCSR